MNIFNKIKKTFFTKQFILFVIVGGINTFNGILFPFLLSFLMHENIAYVLSYVPSLTISYFLNSIFTFKDYKFSFEKYIKFVVSYLPNFAIQNITYIVMHNLLGLHNIFAILLAAVIGVPLTFVILKLFAFKPGKDGNEDDK